jgi:hypothetical protein
MFIEQDYACNANQLKTSDGGKRFMYTVEADKIYDAYYKAIELVRNDTKNLVRLNFCMLKSHFLDKYRFNRKDD